MDSELLSLDRLPLPSLRVYTFLSILAVSSSVYYVFTESDSVLREIAVQRGTSHCNKENLHILIDSAASAIAGKLGVGSDNFNALIRESHINFEDVSEVGSTIDAAVDRSHLPTAFEGGLEKFAKYLGSDYWWSLAQVDNDTLPHLKNGTNESSCANEGVLQLTWQLLQWASKQPHCVWPLVNLAYCGLIIVSYLVQLSVFGNLRSSEQENIRDQFWNLVFYKIVFVFGVVNVQEVEDAIGWTFFMSVIGFLQLARHLCKERHNYLIMVNDETKLSEERRHRILTLLSLIFITSIGLFLGVLACFLKSSSKHPSEDLMDIKNIVPFIRPYDYEPERLKNSTGYDFNLGIHNAIFMLSEIGLLIIQTFHALTMCLFDHMYFRHKSSKWNLIPLFSKEESPPSTENEEDDLYLCISQDLNYRLEIASLLFDLVHHVHMLVCCNLFLSMTSLIVSLQMRMRVRQIHAVLKRRQSFTWLNEHIDKYSDVDAEQSEVAYSDNCAICWESLASQKSKNLPCNHQFHKICLRKWLNVSMHMQCPTCRMSLLSKEEAQLRRDREPRRIVPVRTAVGIMGLLQTGQTLLDLFGGWDPLPDDEGQTIPANVPVFSDFTNQDWPAQTVPTPEVPPAAAQSTSSDGDGSRATKKDE